MKIKGTVDSVQTNDVIFAQKDFRQRMETLGLKGTAYSLEDKNKDKWNMLASLRFGVVKQEYFQAENEITYLKRVTVYKYFFKVRETEHKTFTRQCQVSN